MSKLENFIVNPAFVKLFKENTFDLSEKSNIYYFHNYFNYNYVRDMTSDDNRKKNTVRILEFKKGYTSTYTYYRKCLECLETLYGEWIMCSIPGHKQINTDDNPMNDFLSSINFGERFRIEPGLIKRSEETLAKHEGGYGDRTVEKDLKTLVISDSNVYNKNVIVFDDVTTTGSSLSAAKYLLYEKGAKNVICIAFAKTYERPFFGFYY